MLGVACGSQHASPRGHAGGGDDAGVHAPILLPDANPTPPPSVGGVTPSHAFLARHREILVNGYSTSWTAATRVDLGAGIVITNLSAPTPNFLAVDFGVDPTATPGPRDLTTVDADGGAIVSRGALELDPATGLQRGHALSVVRWSRARQELVLADAS